MTNFRSRKNGTHYPISKRKSVGSLQSRTIHLGSRKFVMDPATYAIIIGKGQTPDDLLKKYNKTQSQKYKYQLRQTVKFLILKAKQDGKTELADQYGSVLKSMEGKLDIKPSELVKPVEPKPQNPPRYKKDSLIINKSVKQIPQYSKEILFYKGKIGSNMTTKLWANNAISKNRLIQIQDSLERLPPAAQKQIQNIDLLNEKGTTFKVDGTEFTTGGHWHRKFYAYTGVKDESAIRIFDTNRSVTGGSSMSADWFIAHEGGHALWDKITRGGSPQVKQAVREFKQAARSEEAVTGYAESYRQQYLKDKRAGRCWDATRKLESTYTENFAECMKIHYSTYTTVSGSNYNAESHPKITKAFFKLIALTNEGHALKLTQKPKILNWLE